MDAQREHQAGSRQTFGLVLAEIAFVEVERRLAVQLEQDSALRARDPASRPELVPITGAAMADPYRRAIEADCAHHALARRTVGADQGLLEARAIAGQSARQRYGGTDHAGDAGDQLAAVDAQTVGENEDAGQVVGCQRPADRLAAGA